MPELMFSKAEETSSLQQQHRSSTVASDINLGFAERSFSAAGAAVLSVILVNPLDVAKTRLQAQAAGVPYSYSTDQSRGALGSLGNNAIISGWRRTQACIRSGTLGVESISPPACFEYKGTMDVFQKIVKQEGAAKLWRGTNASLALAIPTVGIYLPCYDIFRNWIEGLTSGRAPYLTPYVPLIAGSMARSLACIVCYPVELAKTRMQAFKDMQAGAKPPGVRQTLSGVLTSFRSSNNLPNSGSVQSYRILWTGVGAQLARDVPFSAICWSTLEPIRKRILGMVGDEANATSVVGANFSAGFVAGSLAAAATCPLDVAKTRRQIEKDPTRALNMTTWQTLKEVWRHERMKGLFTGAGPRITRAGPSVGIVISFYEVVKYVLHQRHSNS